MLKQLKRWTLKAIPIKRFRMFFVDCTFLLHFAWRQIASLSLKHAKAICHEILITKFERIKGMQKCHTQIPGAVVEIPFSRFFIRADLKFQSEFTLLRKRWNFSLIFQAWTIECRKELSFGDHFCFPWASVLSHLN